MTITEIQGACERGGGSTGGEEAERNMDTESRKIKAPKKEKSLMKTFIKCDQNHSYRCYWIRPASGVR